MSELSTDRFSPVARFSLALGAVLAATAIALSAGTAYLLSRYVVDETSSFTQNAVAMSVSMLRRGALARCRGTQFDPLVADAFARMPWESLAFIADAVPHAHPVAVAG